jgi:hypothetical protein
MELLEQLTGGRAAPVAAGDDSTALSSAPTPPASASQAAEAPGEAFRPSTFSFLRSVASRTEEDERPDRGPATEEGQFPSPAGLCTALLLLTRLRSVQHEQITDPQGVRFIPRLCSRGPCGGRSGTPGV